jgi:hypothetical protein
MKEIDADGMDHRRKGRVERRVAWAAGPGQIMSFDGHDKIVKFGFAIHGGVDWWSGKIHWLRVFTGNHNPRLICKYYLEFVHRNGGILYHLTSVFSYSTRSDHGTENGSGDP